MEIEIRCLLEATIDKHFDDEWKHTYQLDENGKQVRAYEYTLNDFEGLITQAIDQEKQRIKEEISQLDFENLLAPSIHDPLTHRNARPHEVRILDIPVQAKWMKDKILAILER